MTERNNNKKKEWMNEGMNDDRMNDERMKGWMNEWMNEPGLD